MPILTWPGKSLSDPLPSDILDEAVVFPGGAGYPDGTARSRLILGDNLPVMASLLPEYEGKLDLIYADPPFCTNRRFQTRIGRGEDSRHPEEWLLEPGYADHWQELDAYLDYLYPRLVWMYRLLSDRGTLYLHLDWHADAHARLLLDEIFGRENFLNEIIWTYHGPSPIRRAFNRKHDTILAYTKTNQYIFNADAVREPYHPNTLKTFASSPKAGFGKKPNLQRGKVPEDWWYFPVVARLHSERCGYPTQKPEALIERMLLASSYTDSIVADFFCGSGTFPLIAARHGRTFLSCDATWRAVHTTRIRLLDSSQPFRLQREASKKIPITGSAPTIQSANQIAHIGDTTGLDYWEVDPQWNGKLFRSAGQAGRHKRSGEISSEIELPSDPETLRIRTVNLQGEQGEW